MAPCAHRPARVVHERRAPRRARRAGERAPVRARAHATHARTTESPAGASAEQRARVVVMSRDRANFSLHPRPPSTHLRPALGRCPRLCCALLASWSLAAEARGAAGSREGGCASPTNASSAVPKPDEELLEKVRPSFVRLRSGNGGAGARMRSTRPPCGSCSRRCARTTWAISRPTRHRS